MDIDRRNISVQVSTIVDDIRAAYAARWVRAPECR
jgi:hypothetical protein